MVNGKGDLGVLACRVAFLIIALFYVTCGGLLVWNVTFVASCRKTVLQIAKSHSVTFSSALFVSGVMQVVGLVACSGVDFCGNGSC
jgi:hypothetical protein